MEYVITSVNLIVLTAAADWRVVNITQGPVRGYKDPRVEVFAYYGIPYATAPTGPERFKAPLPPPVWSKTFEAVDEYILCPQNPYFYDLTNNQKEDCLIVNVFVPDTNKTNLPVVVYIHGGGFEIGYAETPTQIVNQKKNIIAITFNYRLGPLGFLCLGTKDIPGNAGMRDQVTLLRWVKDNIANFGGNPEDVTIVGCSAGGVSVDLLSLSKMANGLFKKVISLSGASLSVFAVQVDPNENARSYAKIIGYNGEDNLKAIEEFYKTVSIEQLMSQSNLYNKDIAVKLSPCVERDLGFERFLEDTPINILTNGHYLQYPTIYGFANMEGLFRMPSFDDWKEDMNKDFTQFLPADLEFKTEEQKRKVADQIKEFYFGDQSVSNNTVQAYIDFNSDAIFNVAIQRTVTLQVRAGNKAVYLYVFSYTKNNTEVIPYSGMRGATHCSQYTIVLNAKESELTSEYKKISYTMRDLWLNFILTGRPTPEGQTPSSVPQWNPVGENRAPCMRFGSTIEVIGPFEKRRQDFWDHIYDRFHKAPIAPYDF